MDQIIRRKTRPVKIGSVTIGENYPVAVQSMTCTWTSAVAETVNQIKELADAGCELVRLAVPDRESAAAFEKLAAVSPVPLIADIHFDAKLAHIALDSGASKIRINPGNIGDHKKLEKLAKHAARLSVPIRIGVNAGSLEKSLLKKHGGPTAAALVESALGHLKVLENCGFYDTVVSLKASDVYTTVKACRIFAGKNDYPLHIGITEAGPLYAGLIKGSIGVGALLADGIGDTVRISLTAPPVEEVRAARHILQALGLRFFRPDIISCPTCGRCSVDLLSLVNEVEEMLKDYNLPLKVAVMGCMVNGPGEAREADIGIAAGKKRGMLFRHGEVIRTVDLPDLLQSLEEELNLEAARHKNSSKGVSSCQ
ncbi:MAG TPA: flavodoxin-dependent (E)-4-hydroxy-3-methylbut-2-enyl-diphosphate synthase [Firmicutes bacterium]|nr:flavodoxin-dependent (E)-4-hydroxy-3-methylbut-2-enyl-diphosphate synthase [Bacillota bacterium]